MEKHRGQWEGGKASRLDESATQATVDIDEALVRRAREGEEQAFASLYKRYRPQLRRRLLRVLGAGRSEAVEDLVQQTFLQAYRALGRFDQQRAFAPWLHGIAFRLTGNFLRGERRRSWLRSVEPLQVERAVAGETLAADEQASRGQLKQLLYAALETLKPEQRIAFAMYELEGLGYTEIGGLIDASPQTVRARVLKARERVLADLRRRLGGVAAEKIDAMVRRS